MERKDAKVEKDEAQKYRGLQIEIVSSDVYVRESTCLKGNDFISLVWVPTRGTAF